MAEFYFMDARRDKVFRKRSCAPKRVSLLKAWYMLGRKLIPALPNAYGGECELISAEATIDRIVFVIKRRDIPVQEMLIIDRRNLGL